MIRALFANKLSVLITLEALAQSIEEGIVISLIRKLAHADYVNLARRLD